MLPEREWELCRKAWEEHAQHLPDQLTPVGNVAHEQAKCRRAVEIYDQREKTKHFVPDWNRRQDTYEEFALETLYYALGQLDYMRGRPDDGLNRALRDLSHEKHYGPPGTIPRYPLSFGRVSGCWNGTTNPIGHRG